MDNYHWVGVDFGSKPDRTVISVECGNCGTYRMVWEHNIVEECPFCGDDEYDLYSWTDDQLP